MRNHYIFIVLLCSLVAVVIVIGFIAGGTPVSQRALSLDGTRLSDFSSIKYRIENYYRDNKKLPSKISELKGNFKVQDPETKSSYDYNVLSDKSYELCATFSTDSSRKNEYESYYYPSSKDVHKKGYDCMGYTLPAYIVSPYQNDYPSIIATPTISPSDYAFLKPCKLEIDDSQTSSVKIMGIYEQENSVVFTTNKLVNSSVEYWREDPSTPSTVYMYANSIFDTGSTGAKFNKVMRYRIKIFNASGDKTNSESYIFQGNRTIVDDPRCFSLSPTIIQ